MLIFSLLIIGNDFDVIQKLLVLSLIVVLCTIVYLLVINIRTLRKVIKLQSSEKKRKINDERYYELNNKIQLLIVVSSIIFLTGGFIGYNSIDSINRDIRNKISGYEKIIEDYDSLILELEGWYVGFRVYI